MENESWFKKRDITNLSWMGLVATAACTVLIATIFVYIQKQKIEWVEYERDTAVLQDTVMCQAEIARRTGNDQLLSVARFFYKATLDEDVMSERECEVTCVAERLCGQDRLTNFHVYMEQARLCFCYCP